MNRHDRRAQSVIKRRMVRLARKQQAEHFDKLKRAIVGMLCAKHRQPCTQWWLVPDKGAMPLCDGCVPERIQGDRLLRVLPQEAGSPLPLQVESNLLKA